MPPSIYLQLLAELPARAELARAVQVRVRKLGNFCLHSTWKLEQF